MSTVLIYGIIKQLYAFLIIFNG